MQVPAEHIVKTVRKSLTLEVKAKKYYQLHGVSQDCRVSEANKLCIAWCIEHIKEEKYGMFVGWIFRMSPEKMWL